MNSIPSPHTYHSLYLAVYRAHLADRDTWNIAHCTRVITAIMGGRQFSWRVVGITETALKSLRENGYKRTDSTKITRAHLRERSDSVRELLSSPEKSQVDFLEFWAKNDPVVLCGPGENKKSVGPYIPIENESAELFGSGIVSWRHGQLERDFLAALYDSKFGLSPSL